MSWILLNCKYRFSIKIYLKKAELARRRIQSECDSTEQLVQSATEQLSQELQEAANQAADALSNELEEAENDAQLENSAENSATASLPLPIPALPNKVKKAEGSSLGLSITLNRIESRLFSWNFLRLKFRMTYELNPFLLWYFMCLLNLLSYIYLNYLESKF